MSLKYEFLFQILSAILIITTPVILFVIIFKFLKSNNQIENEIDKLEEKIRNLEEK